MDRQQEERQTIGDTTQLGCGRMPRRVRSGYRLRTVLDRARDIPAPIPTNNASQAAD
jgi:hypothetical protein